MAFLGARPARPTCVAAAQAAGCRRALRACFLGGGQSWDLRRSVAAPSQQRRRQRPSPPPTVAGEPVWRGDKDVLKEDRLKLFRTVYNFQAWAAHRSTQRYLRHFMGLFRSRIVSGLRVPLLLIALESTLVCAYEAARNAQLLPAAFRSIQIRAPMLFSLSSFALSLLLVFRTNQSYARFDEGRRLWSVMANRCRDIMRQACSYLGPPHRDLLGVLCRWVQAFPWVLKNYVRQNKTWQADLGHLLRPAELSALLATPNPPLLALQIITELLDRLPISTKQRLRLDVFCSDLADVVGASERLLTTPIPLSYTRHTARFLVIWLALLPFSIYNQCGWVTVFSSVILGFFLLSIEEIGVTIEEPFNILPLSEINKRVCADMARYPQQLDSVVSLVDDATGTARPNTNLHFVPVAQFIAAKGEGGKAKPKGGKGEAAGSNGSGGSGGTDAEDAGAMVS